MKKLEPKLDLPASTAGKLIKAGVTAVPALRLALGLAAIAALMKTVMEFGLTAPVIVFGILIAIVLMVVLFIFTRIVNPKPGISGLKAASVIMLWASLVLTLSSLICLFLGAFFGIPLDLREYLAGRPAAFNGDNPPESDAVKLSGATGQWLSDAYFDCRVAHPVRGTLMADDPYSVNVEIRNKTGATIQIAKIVTERYNHKVAQLLGQKNDKIFTHDYSVVTYLQPNEAATVSVDGNGLLPKTMIIRIFHNLSREPSRFEVDLGGIEVPLSGPRDLPEEALKAGFDGLDAARLALREGVKWSGDAYLIAAFPADSKTYWDTKSGLKYIEPGSWAVTLYSKAQGKAYSALVYPTGVVKGSPNNGEGIGFSYPLPLPKIGSMEALRIINERKLAFADWKDLMIEEMKVQGRWTYCWRLPYRGRNSLPIILDAFSGNVLEGLQFETTAAKSEPNEQEISDLPRSALKVAADQGAPRGSGTVGPKAGRRGYDSKIYIDSVPSGATVHLLAAKKDEGTEGSDKELGQTPLVVDSADCRGRRVLVMMDMDAFFKKIEALPELKMWATQTKLDWSLDRDPNSGHNDYFNFDASDSRSVFAPDGHLSSIGPIYDLNGGDGESAARNRICALFIPRGIKREALFPLMSREGSFTPKVGSYPELDARFARDLRSRYDLSDEQSATAMECLSRCGKYEVTVADQEDKGKGKGISITYQPDGPLIIDTWRFNLVAGHNDNP